MALTQAQREHTAAERKGQGLPPKITDVATLDRIAGMVLAALGSDDSQATRSHRAIRGGSVTATRPPVESSLKRQREPATEGHVGSRCGEVDGDHRDKRMIADAAAN